MTAEAADLAVMAKREAIPRRSPSAEADPYALTPLILSVWPDSQLLSPPRPHPERLAEKVLAAQEALLVFASGAKQSRETGRFRRWRIPGLLRSARKDGGATTFPARH